MELNENFIINTLDWLMDRKPSLVVENTVNDYGSFKIEVYLSSDPEDKMFISGNREFIKDFLDRGYERAGLGTFFGCIDPKAVKRNATMLKVARESNSNVIIAMSIYSSRWGGFKCVGATATTDQSLRRLGVEALSQMVVEDAKLWNKFIWAECSGKMDIMWSQANAIKIPHAYLSLFMDEKTLATVETEPDELYEYTRVFNKGTLEEVRISKTVYGFPNKDVLLKYIKDTDTTLEELCAKYGKDISDVVLEGFNYRAAPQRLWPDLKILMHFRDVFKIKGISHLTQHEMDVLVNSASNVHEGLEKYWKHLNSKDEKVMYSLILTCMMMANCCTILRPYELGELLVPETRKFSADEMFPSCL